MENATRQLIAEFSPMWTNKQIWEFEQTNENLKFDLAYLEPGDKFESISWNSKYAFLGSEVRDTVVKTFDNLYDGLELWITIKNEDGLKEQYFPYLMAVLVDVMIDEEICLNFKQSNNCLIVSIDAKADIIDCKEFFEAFYHLATGFNYNIDTGIPTDETEAEMYLKRLQEEFDEKMKIKLGDKYLPGNNDPDTLNAQ